MNNLAKLPEKAFVTNPLRTPGNSTSQPPVIGLKRGESGYYPIWTRATAAELNELDGVTPAQARR